MQEGKHSLRMFLEVARMNQLQIRFTKWYGKTPE